MKVLIADDDPENRKYLADLIHGWGYEVSQASDGKEAFDILSSSVINVLLTDLMMPRVDGFELLKTLGAEGRLPPAIVMTAFGSIDKALETVHDLGGFWYIEKPVDVTTLEVLLTRAGAQSKLANENDELRRQLSFHGILGSLIGTSQAMTNVFHLIRQVAPTSAPVLITGESGTGKEMVARALHEQSRRKTGPFIALNCAAIPETLIESELFGHERGAFTGAVDRRIGALEAGYGGTLFLDELGEMPVGMQAKLLRVLEDFQFRRLGSRQELKADVRILAATNREPLKAIQAGKLREDLYYRINVFHLHLPPLRDRKEDIPLLVEAMIHSLNKKHDTRVTHATPEFLAALQDRNWEGNVRELRNVVERAVILAGSGAIRITHGPFGMRPEATTTVLPTIVKTRVPPQPIGDLQAVPVRVGMTIGEAERLLIEATFQHEGMNRTRTASILDISTKTLLTKLRQYHLFGEDPLEDDARA